MCARKSYFNTFLCFCVPQPRARRQRPVNSTIPPHLLLAELWVHQRPCHVRADVATSYAISKYRCTATVVRTDPAATCMGAKFRLLRDSTLQSDTPKSRLTGNQATYTPASASFKYTYYYHVHRPSRFQDPQTCAQQRQLTLALTGPHSP